MSADPTGALDLVLSSDPNLDPSMDLLAYLRTRDPVLIKDKDKTCPAVRFHAVGISFDWLCRIDDAHPESHRGRWRDAVLAGVRSITLPDGSVLKPNLMSVRLGDATQQIADTAWLKLIKDRWGMEGVYELGRAIYNRACAPEADTLPLR